MGAIFTVRRNDGKTDAIFEADFKNGKFVGDGGVYSFDQIEYFTIPTEVVVSLLDKHGKSTKLTSCEVEQSTAAKE